MLYLSMAASTGQAVGSPQRGKEGRQEGGKGWEVEGGLPTQLWEPWLHLTATP